MFGFALFSNSWFVSACVFIQTHTYTFHPLDGLANRIGRSCGSNGGEGDCCGIAVDIAESERLLVGCGGHILRVAMDSTAATDAHIIEIYAHYIIIAEWVARRCSLLPTAMNDAVQRWAMRLGHRGLNAFDHSFGETITGSMPKVVHRVERNATQRGECNRPSEHLRPLWILIVAQCEWFPFE